MGREKGKESFIVVMAEGAGDAASITKKLENLLNIEVRLTILGYMQRGGVPSSFSRELACKLGAAAVESMLDGDYGYLVGAKSDRVNLCPIQKVLKSSKKIDMNGLRIANMLAT